MYLLRLQRKELSVRFTGKMVSEVFGRVRNNSFYYILFLQPNKCHFKSAANIVLKCLLHYRAQKKIFSLLFCLLSPVTFSVSHLHSDSDSVLSTPFCLKLHLNLSSSTISRIANRVTTEPSIQCDLYDNIRKIEERISAEQLRKFSEFDSRHCW